MGDLTFATQGTEDIFYGKNTPGARGALPKLLWKRAQRKLDMLKSAEGLQDLKSPPSNHLHALDGDRKGQHAIWINDQYRICFVWTDKGAKNAEVCDYHP